MFFRKKPTQSGFNWQLVESFRNEEGKERQRIVVSLGNASLLGEQERKVVAKVLERKLRHQRDLFSDEQDVAPLSRRAAYWIDRIYRQIVRDSLRHRLFSAFDSEVEAVMVFGATRLPQSIPWQHAQVREQAFVGFASEAFRDMLR